MDTSHNPAESGLPREMQITVPPGDNPLTCEHLLQSAVAKITQALSEITEILDVHADVAPVTALRVTDLAFVVANTAIEWLEAWD